MSTRHDLQRKINGLQRKINGTVAQNVKRECTVPVPVPLQYSGNASSLTGINYDAETGTVHESFIPWHHVTIHGHQITK